jgi:hypothetical protein
LIADRVLLYVGIVFRSWRITGFSSLVISLIAIVALSAGYEAIKEAARQFEARSATDIAKDANNIARKCASLFSKPWHVGRPRSQFPCSTAEVGMIHNEFC